MMAHQSVSEFNLQANNVKFLSYSDEIVFSQKLKVIQTISFDEIAHRDSQDFFSNLYHLLSQSGSTKSGLLDVCLDILLKNLSSNNVKVKNVILNDSRFLSILIGNIMAIEDGNDQSLIKILMVFKELLAFNSELSEHNLKIMVEVLKDHTENHQNKEIAKIALHVLANLCLSNLAAKYLVTRSIKATHLKDKINQFCSDLLAFKFFILLEEDCYPTDIKHFFAMSFREIKASLSELNSDAVQHSLDVIKHMKLQEIKLDFKIREDEKLIKMFNDLNGDLIEKLSSSSDSHVRDVFFERLFLFFAQILELDSELVNALERFTETAFLSGGVSRSSSALKFLAMYVKLNGSLPSSEIIIEGLLDHFIGDQNQQKLSNEEKCAFLSLLQSFHSKDMLSEVHFESINGHFSNVLEIFQHSNIRRLQNDDVSLFVFFMSALASFSKGRSQFYGKLSCVLKLDILPALIIKAQQSRNEEILLILIQLSHIENFPNKKIVSMQAKSGPSFSDASSQGLLESFQNREKNSSFRKNSKYIDRAYNEPIGEIISKLNKKLENNDLDDSTAEVVELYRLKINSLSDHLVSVTSSLERATIENAELQHKIASIGQLTEKQEFISMCLQLDKKQLTNELKTIKSDNACFKSSLSLFRGKIDKLEESKHEIKVHLKTSLQQIKDLTASKAVMDKKLEETKSKLNMAQHENETRIVDLKNKLTTAEKDVHRLQEQSERHVKEIVQKQEKLVQYEIELKESEQMKNTIMSLMQSRSYKK